MSVSTLGYSHPPPESPNLLAGEDSAWLLMASRGCWIVFAGMFGKVGFELRLVVNEATPFSLGMPPLWAYIVVRGVLLLGAILCAFPRHSPGAQADGPLRSRYCATIGLAFSLQYDLLLYLTRSGSLIHPSSVVIDVLYYLALFGGVIGSLGIMQLLRARATQLGMGWLENWLRMAFRIYLVTGTASALLIVAIHVLGRPAMAFYRVWQGIDLLARVATGFAWCLLLMGCWSLAIALRRTALAGNSGEVVSQ